MKNTDYLQHHGVQKQKWGIRRFQNEDGGLTPAGKEHYRKGTPASAKRFDTNRYTDKNGSLTYMGNQKFDKSEKFNELRRKRKKSGNNVGHVGISLITASVSSSGKEKADSAVKQMGNMSISTDDSQYYQISGVDSVSSLFGGASFA